MSSTYTFTGVPSVLHFPGGYCTFEGSSLDAVPHYFTTDYQGNVRIVSAQDGTVEQVTNYYPFGAPYSDGTSTSVSLQPHKYNGKELDMTHGWNTYDYGARIYDPILCQWTSPDPLTGEYPWMSPYVYCGNDPINAVDSDGRSIYMLFYTTGNGEKDDNMFKTAAETRKKDILNDKGFDSNKDIIILQSISDLGEIRNLVDNIVNKYSAKYGNTVEFSFWSHSGLDGPIGTSPTSNDPLEIIQMTIEGWSKIDFNWENNASAYFYGCRSGVPSNGHASFTTDLSALQNFKNVYLFGQSSYSYPSIYTNRREVTWEMMNGIFTYPTYMVGGKKGEGFKAYYHGIPAPSMRKSYNGKGYLGKFYQYGKQY